jgi:hypothetical protein
MEAFHKIFGQRLWVRFTDMGVCKLEEKTQKNNPCTLASSSAKAMAMLGKSCSKSS